MKRLIRRSLLLIVFCTALCTALCAQVPVLNQPLSPAAAAPGGTGFTMTVTGTNFASHAFLNWNGSPRTTTVISSSRLQATISAADIAHLTTASVTVVNPFPFGGSSNVVYFPVRQSAAAVAFAPEPGVTPLAGPAAVGDFNHDRKLDLVVGQTSSDGTSGSILFYPGNGDGTFGTPVTTLTSLPVLSVMTGDFNGDGKLDVLIGVQQPDFGPAQGIVLLGNGAGHFQAQTAFGSGDAGGPIAVADVNGDGILDVIFEGQVQGSGLIYTYLGNGDGTFTMKSVQGINSVGVVAAIGDFNGDGKLDLAVPELRQVDIFLGNGDGTFKTYVPYSVSCQNGPVVAADLNGDGHLDLAMGDLCILLGNGDGTFTVGPNYGSGGTAGLAIADFNGDGKLDIAVGGGPIQVYLGNGDGTLQNAITSGGFANNLMEVLPIGDFNRDGKIDVATWGSAAVQVGLQTSLYVSPNPVSFGSQRVGTHGAAQVVTLSNISPQQIPLSSITLGGADPGDFIADVGCGTKLQGGKSCAVKIFFAPTATGTRTASLIITYTGIDSPQTVGLSGTGK
jgi:hypothetical protein